MTFNSFFLKSVLTISAKSVLTKSQRTNIIGHNFLFINKHIVVYLQSTEISQYLMAKN